MQLWRINETSSYFRVSNQMFLGLDSTGTNLVATSTRSEEPGTFKIIKEYENSNHVHIEAPNGFFLQVKLHHIVFSVYILWRSKPFFLILIFGLYFMHSY